MFLQTEAIKHDLETKMSHHRLEHQIERAQYNQTAVMLMIESCALIRDNTSRAVTSLDNMVLYFMKAKGSENDTSLMGLLQVSTKKNPYFTLFHSLTVLLGILVFTVG